MKNVPNHPDEPAGLVPDVDPLAGRVAQLRAEGLRPSDATRQAHRERVDELDAQWRAGHPDREAGQVLAGFAHARGYADGVTARTRPAWCPAWCTEDHAAQVPAGTEPIWACERTIGTVPSSEVADEEVEVRVSLLTHRATGQPVSPGLEILVGRETLAPAAARRLVDILSDAVDLVDGHWGER